MSVDLRADSVFEWSYDLAARGVILGVRREYQHYIERHSNGISLNLNVALLHDVEQSNLHFAGEVGKLIDREDASVRSRQKSVVDRQFVGEQMPSACRLDWIQIADQIS